ncbi:MAG: type II toxin-antitoxin system RelE/ParE family toxin [Nitrospinae bacterium]|nr:type II toxin-antitoxin system RelE/ParE family toxin [Nitrospinota bacterium]
MKIRNVVHKGLRRFIEQNDSSGIPSTSAEKIRNIVSFLQEMGDANELGAIPGWKARKLSGDRRGIWSLAVTRNWRITFGIDPGGKEIIDLDYEDYH